MGLNCNNGRPTHQHNRGAEMYNKLLMLRLQPALSVNGKGETLGVLCRGGQLETRTHETVKKAYHELEKKGLKCLTNYYRTRG